MRFLDYLKDKGLILILNIFIFSIVTLFMILFNFGSGIIFALFFIWFSPLISYIIFEFFKEKKFFDDITEVTKKLDRKFLLPEVINKPNFLEGKIMYDVLKDTNKDMHEHVKHYKEKQREYREYIEMWVHEIKTPIASSKLIIDNNKNELTQNISKELKKIDEMVEQVLYYSKSDEANKDYIVKEFSIKKAINNVIKKNSRDFIEKRISLDIKEVDLYVFSDIKWVEFIINQIIINSLKYTNKGGRISIHTKKEKNKIILIIEDNGVGIIEEEINKVFLKGFTGENGRIFGKSTGIGLYLCKTLCDKLGLGLDLQSRKNEGTRVSIIFPLGQNTNFY